MGKTYKSCAVSQQSAGWCSESKAYSGSWKTCKKCETLAENTEQKYTLTPARIFSDTHQATFVGFAFVAFTVLGILGALLASTRRRPFSARDSSHTPRTVWIPNEEQTLLPSER